MSLEHRGDEVHGVSRDLGVIWKAVLVAKNALVSSFHILRFVGRFSNKDGVHDHSHGPYVNFERVSTLAFVVLDHFRSNVVRRTAYGFALFIFIFQAGSQAKISYFDIEVLIEEQVTKLQIAVDDVLVVHVDHGLEQLPHEESCLGFGEPISAFDHLIEALIVAEF